MVDSGIATVDSVGQHANVVRIATGASDSATVNVSGGWLNVENEIVIGGAASSQATLNLSGGVLTTNALSKGEAGAFNFTGGVLRADTVNFSLVNNGGTLAPGHSPGLTHVAGDLTLNSGILEIEIGGTSPSQYDKVLVDGVTHLGGTLKVRLIDVGNGLFAPQAGDQFGFLASQLGTSDMFDVLDLPALAPGLVWALSPGNVTTFLSVISSAGIAGDYNNNGIVDAADYTVWRDALGASTALPNETASLGIVDQADYDAWKNNFGATGSGSGAAGSANGSVPEPTTFALLTIGALLGTLCSKQSPDRR